MFKMLSSASRRVIHLALARKTLPRSSSGVASSSATAGQEGNHVQEGSSEDCDGRLYDSHIPTSLVQKAVLGAGSALAALLDPWRADMVAVNGEVTGGLALAAMRKRMASDPEGAAILADRPRINTSTVDFSSLLALPEGSLGRVYADYSARYGISPDTRAEVQFVDDPELAYVLQRYREAHDVVHSVLEMPTDMVGEVAVKWVEALQTGLPMCAGGALLGPLRFTPRQARRFREVRPWAVRVGTQGRFLMCAYFERRWEQGLDDFRREFNIEAPPPQIGGKKR